MIVELTYGPYRVRSIEGTREWEMVDQPLGVDPLPMVRSVPDMGNGRLVWAAGGRPTTLEDAASYAEALTKLVDVTAIDDDLASYSWDDYHAEQTAYQKKIIARLVHES